MSKGYMTEIAQQLIPKAQDLASFFMEAHKSSLKDQDGEHQYCMLTLQ
jgi:hypothetical protein